MNSRIANLFIVLAALSGCAFEQPADVEGSEAAVTGRPYFQVFEGGDSHYFRLKAANHRIILASQAYSTRTAALNGVLSVLDNGEDRARFELLEAANGEWYFNLESRNGRVIGRSETYTTAYSAQRGADAVVRNVGEYLDYLANRTGARFQTFQGADDRFYFNLYAANGEIVLSSQGYSSEEAALNATFSVAENGVDEDAYDVTEAANGEWYFNLTAANGAVIGTSETYSTRSNATRACGSIVALLPNVDLL